MEKLLGIFAFVGPLLLLQVSARCDMFISPAVIFRSSYTRQAISSYPVGFR